jgi:hypothetical protein
MRTGIVSLALSATFVMAGAAWAAEKPAKGKFPKREGWIKLFDGKDLKGWHPRRPDAKMSWKVEKGVLVNDLKPGQHGVDIISEEKFEDFELHIEFKVPKRGNSGVYLRGRYEVQVCDSFGEKATAESCGAIYGQKPPSENASLKPGEWQTYDITLKGKTLTVHQNGKLIIDKYELPGPTGGALDDKVNEPGPLMLQGDHTAVDYRNIYIKPLKK